MNLGDRHDIKTIDMHTNILEGLIYLCRASGDSKYLEALRNIFHLIITKGIHLEYRCGITAFDYDWNPVPDVNGKWTTYECGDWYQDVHWDSGKPLTMEKGLEWETAFHASRALIQTIQAIERIGAD